MMKGHLKIIGCGTGGANIRNDHKEEIPNSKQILIFGFRSVMVDFIFSPRLPMFETELN